MSKQWRCAVVGTGVVGDWHVKLINKVPNAKLVAVCDLVEEKARKSLEKNGLIGLPVYKDQVEMMKKEQVEVIHVCTPSGDHMRPAMLAMEHGKNVITEKPMEIQLDRIDQMTEYAKKQGVKIAGVFQNRWNPANRAIKDAMAEGRFGRLTWAGSFTPWYRTDQYYKEAGWRGTWKLDGGGAVMNQSVHSIDLLQWIIGPVKRVSAYMSSRIHAEIEVEDTLSCSLEFENGGFGTILGTTAMYPGMPPRIEVGGENGTAISENGLRVWKFREERPADLELLEKYGTPLSEQVKDKIKAAGGDAVLEKMGLKKAASATAGGASNTDVKLDLHSRNIEHILSSWEAGKEADTYGPEARKSVAIVLAMYESARKRGAPVDVK